MNDLFSLPEYHINKPIRLIELFAGVGSQSMALKMLGVEFEHYKVCEFDKYAIQSYNAIHNTNFQTSDITKIKGQDLKIVDTDKYEYILTYSFCCQDLSLAGKQKGMKKGSGTRSGLLWEVERLLNECNELPQVLVMENVTEVHSAKNIEDFILWLKFLESKGYTNNLFDLNAKDYGTAQSRLRCFMVSVLGEFSVEKPKKIELKKRVVDYLQEEVDEKYYLKSEKADKLIEYLKEKGKIPTHRQTTNNKQQTTNNKQQTTNNKQQKLLMELICVSSPESSKSQMEYVQDTIQESNDINAKTQVLLKSVCSMNYKKVDETDLEIAKTLCARDYKGFGTGYDTMNGIIEVCT